LKLRSQCGLVGRWPEVEEDGKGDEEGGEEDGSCEEQADNAPDRFDLDPLYFFIGALFAEELKVHYFSLLVNK